MPPKAVPVTPGETHHRLTVLREIEPQFYTPLARWIRKVRVICRCGNERNIYLHALRSGNSKSCGCFKTEVLKKTNSKKGRQNAAKK